jgi:hypothetical protein
MTNFDNLPKSAFFVDNIVMYGTHNNIMEHYLIHTSQFFKEETKKCEVRNLFFKNGGQESFKEFGDGR